MSKKSIKSIGERLSAVRDQIRAQVQDDSHSAANDLLKDIEMRWGPGFAQWVVDGLKDASDASQK